MNKSHLLINEPPLQVLPSLAVEIGLNEAIVIQQLHYWMNNSKVGVDRDGFKWIFNTYQEWQENFPFWSVSTIQRIFSNLEEKGLIISEQLDKKSHDMTKFYRLNYDELCKMEHVKMESSDMSNRHDVNKNTETTTKNSKSLSEKDYQQANAKVDAIIGNTQPREQTEILHDFERSFGFGSLPWNSNTIWTKFAKWVIAHPGWFADYVQWRNGDGKYRAFSNKKIRENPAAFIDTGYPEYEASKMYRKTDEARPEYKPINREDDQHAVPNPYQKPANLANPKPYQPGE